MRSEFIGYELFLFGYLAVCGGEQDWNAFKSQQAHAGHASQDMSL